MSKLDIDNLTRTYFYFDKPVPYKLKDGNTLNIYPICLSNYEYFIDSIDIFKIDKNTLGSVDIIQMSYLKFICFVLFNDQINIQKFVNIMLLSCKLNAPNISLDDDGKIILSDTKQGIKITEKEFDDIRRIILYQNLTDYDETYIDPSLKAAMEKQDAKLAKRFEPITLERKVAIITSHCGISKKEQLEMTMRSHTILFEEVCGEVQYSAIMPVALIGGNGDKVDGWIYRKRRGKYDKYITSMETFGKKLGMETGKIQSKIVSGLNDELLNKI